MTPDQMSGCGHMDCLGLLTCALDATRAKASGEGLDTQAIVDAVNGAGYDALGMLTFDEWNDIAIRLREERAIRIALADPAPAGLDVAWAALERERNFNASDIEVVLRKYDSGDGYHEPREVGWRAEMRAHGAFAGLTKPYIGDIAPSPADALLSLLARLQPAPRTGEEPRA